MKGSVPKIIIKARAPPPPADSPAADSPQGSASEDAEIEGEQENSPAMDVDNASSPSPTEGLSRIAEDEGSQLGTPAPRPRGRPRGRGRGGAPVGGTPRARGRGRGRGRGKGRASGALTIKLPKRGDDEEGEGDLDGEGTEAGGGEEGTPVEGPPEVAEVPVKEVPMGGGKPFRKIQGEVYVIDGDEFVTESNPKGDEKIDQWGNLLGGRQFKASTFILPNRHPHRRYMLAIDAARTSGFRDSLYYFRRNLLAFKLNATQPEKDYLISEGKLGSHLRTRSVTLVTARSAFKLHGAKTILDGRWVTDDYYEEKVLEEITAKGLKAGDLVGELPDPNAKAHTDDASALAAAAAGSSKNDRSGGGGGMYRAGGPTTIFGGSGWGPYSDGPLNAVRKSLLSRDGVTEENWMWMMSMRVLEADEEWAKWRKESLKANGVDNASEAGPSGISEKPELKQSSLRQDITKIEGEEQDDGGKGKGPATAKRKRVTFESNPSPLGIYEPHSGLVHYRSDTQPTSSRWEMLPDSKRILGGTRAGNGAWALAWVDTVMELPAQDGPPSPASLERDRLMKEALAAEPIDLTTGDP